MRTQPVAIKRVVLEKNRTLDQLARREAQLLAKLRHPNIVGFICAIFDDKACYLVMEYCSGGDLHDRMHQRRSTGCVFGPQSVPTLLTCSRHHQAAVLRT
jgi:serine/threonine protein kinase